MTKTKEKVDEGPAAETTAQNGHDHQSALSRLVDDVPADLRRQLEGPLKDIHKAIDPVLTRLESALERTDLLAVLAERNRTIEEIRAVLSAETISVKEEKCVLCGREQGETHARGTCAAQARLAEARERIENA